MAEEGLVPGGTEHRELTEEEIAEAAALAYDLEQRIKGAVLVAHAAWWELARATHEFHELQGWTLLGHDSLAAFLAQPDVGMKERSFHYARRTWRDLAVVKEIPMETLKDVEPSKAREVVPAIMRGDVEPEDALDDARGLSYRDVVEKYHDLGAQIDAPLDAETEPERIMCSECGRWYVPDHKGDAALLQGQAVIDGHGLETTDGR